MSCPKCGCKSVSSTLVAYIGKDRNTRTCSECGYKWEVWQEEELKRKTYKVKIKSLDDNSLEDLFMELEKAGFILDVKFSQDYRGISGEYLECDIKTQEITLDFDYPFEGTIRGMD